MDIKWIIKIIETLAIGAAGGMSAYWLAQRRFVRERSWEKRYELYGEIFDILNQLSNSLVILEHAVRADREYRQGSESRDAATSYNAGLLRLNNLQVRLMLLGADEAHMRLMVVYAGLRVFYPEMVIEPIELKGVEIQELADLIKSCYREASGRNGEFAFLARRDLGMNSWRIVRWWRRITMKARLKKWVASYGDQMNRSQDSDTKEEKNDTV